MNNWSDPQLPLMYGDRYEERAGIANLLTSSDSEDELVSWLKSQARQWFAATPATLMPMTVALGMRSGLVHIMRQETATPDEMLTHAQRLILISRTRPDPVVLGAVLGESHILLLDQDEDVGAVKRSLEDGTIDILAWGQPAVSLSVFRSDKRNRVFERMLVQHIDESDRAKRKLLGEWREDHNDPDYPENVAALRNMAPSV